MISTIARITAFGETHNVSLKFDRYVNGRIAIRVMNNEGTFGMLTVNIPNAHLEDDEFIVKNYSENAGWADELVNQLSDSFENTGRFATSGFVRCPIYKIKS